MARRNRRRSYTAFGDDGDLNLTPLLDVIFNLIFFFVVATTIRTEESFFDITLPEVSEASPREVDQELHVVYVTREGGYALDELNMNGEQLLERLRKFVAENPRVRIVLKADAEATVQQATDAMGIIQKAGITEIIQPVKIPN